MSVELRRALGSLEEITGERVDEGILDRIFERFLRWKIGMGGRNALV